MRAAGSEAAPQHHAKRLLSPWPPGKRTPATPAPTLRAALGSPHSSFTSRGLQRTAGGWPRRARDLGRAGCCLQSAGSQPVGFRPGGCSALQPTSAPHSSGPDTRPLGPWGAGEPESRQRARPVAPLEGTRAVSRLSQCRPGGWPSRSTRQLACSRPEDCSPRQRAQPVATPTCRVTRVALTGDGIQHSVQPSPTVCQA